MEFVKRIWAQATVQLNEMPATSKLLIGMVVVVLLLVGFLVMLYVGQPSTVPITGFTDGRTEEVLARLQARGIDASQQGSQIVVPVDQQDQAIMMLVEQDLLREDPSSAFNDLISNSPFTETRFQSDRRYLLAKQSVLGRLLANMKGVRRANVVISMPQDIGLGVNHAPPTASVSITMQGGAGMNQALANSVASFVARAAAAEMTPQDVVVIDANTGQQFTVRDALDAAPGDLLKQKQAIEDEYRDRIAGLFRHIRGTMVAVNARLDSKLFKETETQVFEDSEPLLSTKKEEMRRTTARDGGEPGVRPNVGADIAAGSGGGTTEETVKKEETFGPKNVVEKSRERHAGHMIQHVAVTINLPRSYFVKLYKAQNPDDADPPDDAKLEPLIARQTQTFEAQVKPQINFEQEGDVAIAMYYDDLPTTPETAGMSGSGMMAMVESSWFTPAVLVGLALGVLGLTLWMVRQATRPETMPSVEELAGVPPTLPSEDDLVGEVDAMETSLEGVELDENELKSRKIAEQIGDMINANPEEAGRILGRWMAQDE